MSKEKILEEFEKKFNSCKLTFDECASLDADYWDARKFLSQAIAQTREETIKEILKLMPTIYEETTITRYDFLITLEDKLKSLINK